MSTNKCKYIILPYKGKFEKIVDVKVTVPQDKMKYEYMYSFLDYVYLLEDIAVCVKEQNFEEAKSRLSDLKNSEFMVFKPATKKGNK